MLIAIDIGNTNVTIGCFKKDNLQSIYRIEANVPANVGLSNLELKHVTDIIISSVVPKQTENYTMQSYNLYNITPFIIKHNNIDGLILEVDEPDTVGADRICNVIAAQRQFNSPCIIVDFGTATTYDVVDERGAFIGGAIAPGIDVSANYLYQKAALLRDTAFQFPEFAVGKNTETNLQSGIMFGAVDEVEGMIMRIKNEMKWEACDVILTGGFSTIISSGISFKHHVEPNLTLIGMEIINRKLK
ncbi:MAG: type III pantothenate kinase [Candidatus Marinimicrobia bacterium]|nr:type III pantothenate kinase [Candidatus Neomarinimicrobiota bacterium]